MSLKKHSKSFLNTILAFFTQTEQKQRESHLRSNPSKWRTFLSLTINRCFVQILSKVVWLTSREKYLVVFSSAENPSEYFFAWSKNHSITKSFSIEFDDIGFRRDVNLDKQSFRSKDVDWVSSRFVRAKRVPVEMIRICLLGNSPNLTWLFTALSKFELDNIRMKVLTVY